MITYVVGDLFQSPAQVLVNTVNTVGVMGKGIALDFKRVYPEMFTKYQHFCEAGQFNIGQLWIYKTPHKWVLNFPTKKHWRNKSKPEYIESGLKKFVQTYDDKGITSISFPMLGCGNGELDWITQVKPLMEKYLAGLPIDIYIHLYRQDNPYAPEHRNIQEIKKWLTNEPESLAFTEFWSDLVDLIKHNNKFTNIVEKSSEFQMQMDGGQNSLLLTQSTGQLILIDKFQLRDFWQYFRPAGYSMYQNFPSGLDEYGAELISVLIHLPYISPVLLARDNNNNHEEVGVQLMPARKNTLHTADEKVLDIS